MKIAYIIIRTLLGLLLILSSVMFFFNLAPKPELTGDLKLFNAGIEASRYLLPLIKIVELICGIAFIIGRFVTLATLVLFPITLNILLTIAFLAPEGLPIALFILAANLYLAYYFRKNYETLFAIK